MTGSVLGGTNQDDPSIRLKYDVMSTIIGRSAFGRNSTFAKTEVDVAIGIVTNESQIKVGAIVTKSANDNSSRQLEW